MLQVKVKNADRSETSKIFFRSSGRRKLDFKGKTYFIDPHCVYTSYRFLGLMSIRTIDFTEGNPNAVNYFSTDIKKPKSKFTPNLVASVVNKILYHDKLNEIILFLIIVSIICSISVVLFCLQINGKVDELIELYKIRDIVHIP